MTVEQRRTSLSQLAALLETESDALARHDTETVRSLYDQKKRLVDEVAASGRLLDDETAPCRALVAELRRNDVALRRAIAAQQALFGVVSRAAEASKRQRSGQYGSGGLIRRTDEMAFLFRTA